MLAEILVSSSGAVECAKAIEGFQALRPEVEKAIHSWTLLRATVDGRSVAYAGFLEFSLCNLGCPKGPSMTLLK